jgi:hypothetical protein
LIHGISRLTRQQQQVVESGKAPTIRFNIFMDARYHHVKVVGDETSLQASTTSLGKSINKTNVLSIEEE